MLTAIFSGNGRIEKSILAVNLAAWCALCHRKVLIMDASTQKHAFLWCIRRRAASAPLHLPVERVIDTSVYMAAQIRAGMARLRVWQRRTRAHIASHRHVS